MLNRKANYEYFILDKYQAGIILEGCEVKSIRNGHASIDEAYCLIVNGELFIRNMYIKPYEHARDNSEPRRDRKLLLKKKEIRKIQRTLIDKGLTIVPLSSEFKHGRLKLTIGIAKGKKLYDKRESIKKREIDRDLQRIR